MDENEKRYNELLDTISINFEFISSSGEKFEEKIEQFNKDIEEFKNKNNEKTKANFEKIYIPIKEFFNDIQKKSEICNKTFDEFLDFIIKDGIEKHNIKE